MPQRLAGTWQRTFTRIRFEGFGFLFFFFFFFRPPTLGKLSKQGSFAQTHAGASRGRRRNAAARQVTHPHK